MSRDQELTANTNISHYRILRKPGGAEFDFAAPKSLFKTRMMTLDHRTYHEYDVSPDGQRFLIGTLIGGTKAAPPTVILNWAAGLKK